MRHATIRNPDGTTAAARLDGDTLVVLGATDVGELLRAWSSGVACPETGDTVPLAEADLAPLVTRPAKIFCVGQNYATHIKEMGREQPSHPTLFAKFARCLIGARDAITLPSVSQAMDWEAELCVVIGKEARGVDVEDAPDAIAGYTVANDVTARDWQYRTKQWLQGKAFEASTPVGPYLVSGDEVDGASDLAVTCAVDGETMQSGRTSDLVFGPSEVIAYISTFITLEPGDLVLTGTPGGVGHAQDPARYLQPGSVVRTAIEGLGELVNPCLAP